MRRYKNPVTCSEYAGEHTAEARTKGPETNYKCAVYKGSH
jgi:hypothetical protein